MRGLPYVWQLGPSRQSVNSQLEEEKVSSEQGKGISTAQQEVLQNLVSGIFSAWTQLTAFCRRHFCCHLIMESTSEIQFQLDANQLGGSYLFICLFVRL